MAGELTEAPDAEERLAQDQQGPALADEGQSSADGVGFEAVRQVMRGSYGS
jgi:hypothetical protein